MCGCHTRFLLHRLQLSQQLHPQATASREMHAQGHARAPDRELSESGESVFQEAGPSR